MLVLNESPDSVRSTSGVSRTAAAGRGMPSSRARKMAAAARLPPGDIPPTTTWPAPYSGWRVNVRPCGRLCGRLCGRPVRLNVRWAPRGLRQLSAYAPGETNPLS